MPVPLLFVVDVEVADPLEHRVLRAEHNTSSEDVPESSRVEG
jgi:hypothetical protein